MGRHGYSDECDDHLQLGRWRGQVASAIRGKRGQAFLQELVNVLDSMPSRRLIKDELRQDGEVCALGAVGVYRGVDLDGIDPDAYDTIADKFGIAHQLVQEIEYENDEGPWKETPEQRWIRVREWAVSQLRAQ